MFGASPALRKLLRGRPARRLGSIGVTLAASSTASQANAFCLVLFDSSDRMSKALAWKGKLVLAICLKHGPAHDVARNDVRDIILGWMQASWTHSLAIDYTRRHFPRRPRPEVVTQHLSHGIDAKLHVTSSNHILVNLADCECMDEPDYDVWTSKRERESEETGAESDMTE